MAYHYAKNITVDNTLREALPRGMRWRPRGYTVRSEAQGFKLCVDHCDTLTEARHVARQRARAGGWAEIFRFAESGVSLRSMLVAVYDRELRA